MRQVRPAIADDVAALVALDTVASHDPERQRDIATWVAAGQCHVLVEHGRPVAYAVLTHGFFHQPFIEMLMVAAGSRRTGVGRRLLAHVAALLPTDVKLWTSTNASNLPMQALLVSAGFVLSGRVDNLDPGDPEMIYVRLPTPLGQPAPRRIV
jgi:GNAT superfamily N-acetyltransferase